jgi:hypothetical protein
VSTVCQRCGTIVPAGSEMCPKCGHRVPVANTTPDTGPQWQAGQQQTQPWSMEQKPQPFGIPQQRRGGGWVKWLFGCGCAIVLGFLALVVLGFVLEAVNPKPSPSPSPLPAPTHRASSHNPSGAGKAP